MTPTLACRLVGADGGAIVVVRIDVVCKRPWHAPPEGGGSQRLQRTVLAGTEPRQPKVEVVV